MVLNDTNIEKQALTFPTHLVQGVLTQNGVLPLPEKTTVLEHLQKHIQYHG